MKWTNIEGLEEKTTHTDPERIWIGKEMQRSANAPIDGLAPAVQQALMLNTHKGLNYEIVSAVVGCPIGTVRSRISRAREVVSAALAERGYQRVRKKAEEIESVSRMLNEHRIGLCRRQFGTKLAPEPRSSNTTLAYGRASDT